MKKQSSTQEPQSPILQTTENRKIYRTALSVLSLRRLCTMCKMNIGGVSYENSR